MMPLGTHIQQKKKKKKKKTALNTINIIRKLKFQLDRKPLEIIYTSFIRPILEYGNEIWDNCTQYEKDDLAKIQTDKARIATGTTKLVSIENLNSEIGWNTLATRGNKQNLTLFYKMISNLTPYHIFPQPLDYYGSISL